MTNLREIKKFLKTNLKTKKRLFGTVIIKAIQFQETKLALNPGMDEEKY